MASIDPTFEEMQQWTDISSDPTEAASPSGSFLRHLGFTSTAPVRVLGMISATDLIEFLKDWKINGENATPAQRAQAALVGSGARVAAGTQRIADSKSAAPAALAAASSAAPAATPAASNGVTVLPGQDQKSFLELSAVLDQTSDVEFQLMSRAEADDCFKVYDMRFGGAPPDDQEPTVAQFSAMKHVVTHGCVPYADFGLKRANRIHVFYKTDTLALDSFPAVLCKQLAHAILLAAVNHRTIMLRLATRCPSVV